MLLYKRTQLVRKLLKIDAVVRRQPEHWKEAGLDCPLLALTQPLLALQQCLFRRVRHRQPVPFDLLHRLTGTVPYWRRELYRKERETARVLRPLKCTVPPEKTLLTEVQKKKKQL